MGGWHRGGRGGPPGQQGMIPGLGSQRGLPGLRAVAEADWNMQRKLGTSGAGRF